VAAPAGLRRRLAQMFAGALAIVVSGATGILRLFNDAMGGQASWPLVWGGWLVVSGVVFRFGSGVIHTYYTVALAPAIAALIAITGWVKTHLRFVKVGEQTVYDLTQARTS
jgi:hypothetical protein